MIPMQGRVSDLECLEGVIDAVLFSHQLCSLLTKRHLLCTLASDQTLLLTSRECFDFSDNWSLWGSEPD